MRVRADECVQEVTHCLLCGTGVKRTHTQNLSKTNSVVVPLNLLETRTDIFDQFVMFSISLWRSSNMRARLQQQNDSQPTPAVVCLCVLGCILTTPTHAVVRSLHALSCVVWPLAVFSPPPLQPAAHTGETDGRRARFGWTEL
jgi:hypothetical protein